MTDGNLKSAYAGESQAHMRYIIFSKRAEKEGYPNVARLFKAIAYAERIHAFNHYRNIRSEGDALTVSMAAFGSKTSSEDLQIGIDGETFEIEEMYPAYLGVANMQNEYAAEVTFRFAWEAEKTHVELFKNVKVGVDEERDPELGTIGVYEVCGYTLEGDPPEKCPICKAKKERFKIFAG
jgi:rubrerythrin